MLQFQEELALKYKYKKLPEHLSYEVQDKYFEALKTSPIKEFFVGIKPEDYKIPLYTLSGTLIAYDYNEVIIGDYGAFIELDESEIVLDNIKVKEGQEYRYEEKYKTCKYYWLTAKDDSNIKIYHQKGKVSYADYVVGKYYISPYEIST